ncbi:hypothetical protein DVK05_00635 [Halorubrum sp. Atlit-8R]|uniref:hypothetical protein n=1 Tax=unclassified Halorubrum TaxID=2642239 RepID=UPI000EF24778|nr:MULTISPECIES: hypothetical protein [unclassified Halorubrum]RLM71511.1 hypothetical protein DVK08_05130 [Halorubrum sp. Atlit-9R]RLM82334.1 hypothetical protein DVK05_00635 [Halorubrum sp. Atlit-8R]
MTANAPIPLDAFATELESLDGDAFADFVAETYAATADAVDVDPPRVTVTEGGRRTELLAVAAADGTVPDAPADAVVVASDSLLDDLDAGFDADVVTPADLRERLLYGVPPATANAVSDRFLDVPIRSAAYESAAAPAADAPDSGTGPADDDADAVTDDGDESGAGVPGAAAPEPTGDDDGSGLRSADRTAADRTASGSSGDSRADARPGSEAAATDTSDEATATDGASERTDRRALLAAVGVAVLLVAAAGAGFAAGAAGVGGPGGLAGVGGDGASDPAGNDSDPTEAASESDDGSGGSTDGGANTVSVADGDPTGEAARNTAPSPTCERSALQVVQIQMNALRYNDNATNDGIRTLRAFASPQNRDLVGSTEEYAELFETPLYGPMLTYDTAQYSVPDVVDDAAYVEVVTRENGSVTGRYEFRLVRVAGGSGDTDTSLGDVDDCWMTDAVAAATE